MAADAAAAQGVDAGCGAGRGLRLHHQLLQATAACAARARTPSGLQSLISKQPSVLNLGALPALAAPASATPATPVPDPLALPNATVVAVDGKLTEPVSLLPSC